MGIEDCIGSILEAAYEEGLVALLRFDFMVRFTQ
jgi:hypothetical protein